jgi:hypothetical protein
MPLYVALVALVARFRLFDNSDARMAILIGVSLQLPLFGEALCLVVLAFGAFVVFVTKIGAVLISVEDRLVAYSLSANIERSRRDPEIFGRLKDSG